MKHCLKNCCFACLLLIGNVKPVFSQSWHQKIEYQIDVRVDDKANAVQARERVRYTNHSPDTLYRIYFHIAWHGRVQQVAAPYTVFSVQQNGVAIDFQVLESRLDPSLGTQSLSHSLLEIQLSRPLPPGEADVYIIAWQAEIPVYSAGCGRNSPSGVDYTFTNWYPQVCVYDQMGWHLGSPFEAGHPMAFASYKVDITLPQKYMVAATGTLSNADAIGYGYQNQGVALKPNYGLITVWKFQAEQVRDFAWAADPAWQHETKQYRKGLMLHAFYFKNENQLASLEMVLRDYERIAFPCLYPQLSVLQIGEAQIPAPLLVFEGGFVPHLDEAISWGFQDELFKSTYLMRQFRYVTGADAFRKGLAAIMRRYQYSRLPVSECIYLLERSSGLELDWLWQQQEHIPSQVDYAIQSVQPDGTSASAVVLERIGGAVLPVVVEVIYVDSTVEQHYIPVDLLRAKLPLGSTAIPQAVWSASDTKYMFKLPKALSAIKSLVLDPQILSGDVARENNRKDF